jgi:hypothetical protein
LGLLFKLLDGKRQRMLFLLLLHEVFNLILLFIIITTILIIIIVVVLLLLLLLLKLLLFKGDEDGCGGFPGEVEDMFVWSFGPGRELIESESVFERGRE